MVGCWSNGVLELGVNRAIANRSASPLVARDEGNDLRGVGKATTNDLSHFSPLATARRE